MSIRTARYGRELEYDIYKHMLSRCLNPKDKDFHHYGGRGITVCKRWQKSFENFIRDVGERPSRKHSLDRINNDRGYCKRNCRWALVTVQVRNSRHNTYLTFRGKTHCVAEWAEITGIPRPTIHSRLRLGWPITKVLTQPVRPITNYWRADYGKYVRTHSR